MSYPFKRGDKALLTSAPGYDYEHLVGSIGIIRSIVCDGPTDTCPLAYLDFPGYSNPIGAFLHRLIPVQKKYKITQTRKGINS